MRNPRRAGLSRLARAAVLLLAAGLGGCGGGRVAVPDRPGAEKTSAALRAERRLFDGAPPVIPHQPLGAACVSCHDGFGIHVPGLGFAPPSPHGDTPGMKIQAAGGLARCQQCHVFQEKDEAWVETSFAGLGQDLRRGRRLYDGAPPVIPHLTFMRENCQACHSGPAAREEIRTSHPDRPRCRQCHVEQLTRAELVF
jgi:cytochrome c-type protein NapB